jgi:hypothetical protein
LLGGGVPASAPVSPGIRSCRCRGCRGSSSGRRTRSAAAAGCWNPGGRRPSWASAGPSSAAGCPARAASR